MDLWDKIKKWLVGIWDTVCDAASKFGITYPNGLSMGLGWTKWKVPYPTVSISTAVWYPFSFMKNDKADVPIVTPEAIEQPADNLADENIKQTESLSQQIELTEEETEDIKKKSNNIFEMQRKINEALQKKREANKAKKQDTVVPQIITYQNTSGSSGGSSGVYAGQIGSGLLYMR